mgnify:CR=1 FL=1|jgi:hypothetical protein
MAGKNDIVKNQIMPNSQDITPEIIMEDYRWLLSLQIKLNTKKEEMDYFPEIMVDYFKNDKLDLDMLQGYVSIVMNILTIKDGEESSIVYPMKYCTNDMFKNIRIDPIPRDVEKNRLCPDIADDDINYRLVGTD